VFSRISRTDEFESAAMPYLSDLFRAAVRVIGNRSEAEDLVQEAYLQAWKSFDRFEPGTNCRAWLYKILFNVIQHHRRRWYNNRAKIESDEVLMETLGYEAPVRQDLSDEDVLAAFDKIPAQYREVVLLADVQEFTYKEVAETLAIPVGTVMSRLSRGRSLLRQELAGLAANYGIKEGGRSA